MLSNF